MKKFIFILLSLVLLLSTGCQETFVEGQVYPAQRNPISSPQLVTHPGQKILSEGSTPFTHASIPLDLLAEEILIAVSPDGNLAFVMELLDQKLPFTGIVIKGMASPLVRISTIDITSRKRAVIHIMPFVSSVKWNNTGTALALGGDGKLAIYDMQKKRMLLKDHLAKSPSILYFGWSPDGKKLYTEDVNAANRRILYVETEEHVSSYQTSERLYYFDVLDENYYLGRYEHPQTEMELKWLGQRINTVVVNKHGEILNELLPGRLRGVYGRSIIFVGQERFGLYFMPDINERAVFELSEDYIFDAKFVAGGGVAFITATADITTNEFLLNIFQRGEEQKQLPVSGASLALLPSGEEGTIGGPLLERIDFKRKIIADTLGQPAPEHEALYPAIRGAIDTLAKYEILGVKDYEQLREYFTNTIDQWALFDTELLFEREKTPYATVYTTTINITQLEIRDGSASVTARYAARNELGTGTSDTYVFEFVENRDGSWKVTGLSTFPHSREAHEVRTMVEATVKELVAGLSFGGELKDKEVSVGQIQFWGASMPYMSTSVQHANYAKAYLTVGGHDGEEIYRLVLKKQGSMWIVETLSKKNLGAIW